MANYGSRILGSAVSSVSAQQALIGNIGNNIANVNTPGYARRVVDLEARSARNVSNFALGSGVDIGQLRRVTSKYLDRLVHEAKGSYEAEKVSSGYLDRIEDLFPLDDSSQPIGRALDKFFSSLKDLSITPDSINLRKNVIVEATDLVNSIRDTYESLAALQDEADNQITQELTEVNSILADIAQLNGEIKGQEAGGDTASAERDHRDQLLFQLSEKISFDYVEASDGTAVVSLKGGFTLVGGGAGAKQLEINRAPSFLPGSAPPSLNEGVLGFIVYDFSGGSGNGHINVTDRLATGDGTIGGLLKVRGVADPSDTSAFDAVGILPNLAQRLESLTRTLLTEFNQEYLGPDRGTTPGVWVPTAGDLDDNSPSPFGLFSFETTGTLDADADGRPENSDLTAAGFDNFASRLLLTSSDPRAIAAARDSGSGPPAAAVFPDGDSQNLDAIIALQDQSYTFSVGGSYSFDGTVHENYHETVGAVGNYANTSRIDLAVAGSNLQSAEIQRDAISSVSINQEFAKTITYQRTFEASARLVETTRELFQDVVNLI